MSFSAEIIAVGTEILLGEITNTDAVTVARALSELGINAYYQTVVGDNPERLRACILAAKKRADIIITTGGLGPTFDDLTKQVAAEAFGKKLVLHEESLKKIEIYFERRGKKMTDNNRAQAYLPEGCTVLENDWGTAPGCAIEDNGKFLIMLPGPPRECKPMVKYRMLPYLQKLSDSRLVSHGIHIYGMGESEVESKIRSFAEEMQNPTLAPYAKDGEVLLRVTGKAKTEEEADAITRPVIERVEEILGDVVYGVDVPSLHFAAFEILREKKLTLATAESCTGGLCSKLMTDIPGASEVFRGGICAYTNEIKMNLLGIDASLLETHGAVSRECAEALAKAACEKFGTDAGIGVTGYADPSSGDEKNPGGTVYVAVNICGKCTSSKIYQPQSRELARSRAAQECFDILRREAENI
ncbi:MAG: competence/damage-inducible protein A [Oscillospiraceae bacterium]|nr:competence/damage-inducible protein A [Oscillospiraceae bacterium]